MMTRIRFFLWLSALAITLALLSVRSAQAAPNGNAKGQPLAALLASNNHPGNSGPGAKDNKHGDKDDRDDDDDDDDDDDRHEGTKTKKGHKHQHGKGHHDHGNGHGHGHDND